MKITDFKPVLAAAISASALLVCGCVRTLDDHTKAAWPLTGAGIVPERYERSVDQVHTAALWVLKNRGKLIMDDSVTHTLKAMINERTVFVRVTKVDDKTTALDVQARTTLASDNDLAHEIDKQIALQLTVTP
jgi:hypothetical protein